VSYTVYMLDDAEEDLWNIHTYIKNQFSKPLADKIYVGIRDSILMLETNPLLGTTIPQLAALGMTHWRQMVVMEKIEWSMKLNRVASIYISI